MSGELRQQDVRREAGKLKNLARVQREFCSLVRMDWEDCSRQCRECSVPSCAWIGRTARDSAESVLFPRAHGLGSGLLATVQRVFCSLVRMDWEDCSRQCRECSVPSCTIGRTARDSVESVLFPRANGLGGLLATVQRVFCSLVCMDWEDCSRQCRECSVPSCAWIGRTAGDSAESVLFPRAHGLGGLLATVQRVFCSLVRMDWEDCSRQCRECSVPSCAWIGRTARDSAESVLFPRVHGLGGLLATVQRVFCSLVCMDWEDCW